LGRTFFAVAFLTTCLHNSWRNLKWICQQGVSSCKPLCGHGKLFGCLRADAAPCQSSCPFPHPGWDPCSSLAVPRVVLGRKNKVMMRISPVSSKAS